jgi:uncharacterized membrane protein
VLGNVVQSGAFAVIAGTIRPMANDLHERVWTSSGCGYAAPALRSAGFAESSLDQ